MANSTDGLLERWVDERAIKRRNWGPIGNWDRSGTRDGVGLSQAVGVQAMQAQAACIRPVRLVCRGKRAIAAPGLKALVQAQMLLQHALLSHQRYPKELVGSRAFA